MPGSERTSSAVPRSVADMLCFRTLITQVTAPSLQKALVWVLPQSALSITAEYSTELQEGQRAENWRGQCFKPVLFARCLNAVRCQHMLQQDWGPAGFIFQHQKVHSGLTITADTGKMPQKLICAFPTDVLGRVLRQALAVSLKAFHSQLANKVC